MVQPKLTLKFEPEAGVNDVIKVSINKELKELLERVIVPTMQLRTETFKNNNYERFAVKQFVADKYADLYWLFNKQLIETNECKYTAKYLDYLDLIEDTRSSEFNNLLQQCANYGTKKYEVTVELE